MLLDTLPLWLAPLLVACHAVAPPAFPSEGRAAGAGAALFYRFVGEGSDVLVMIHGGPGMDSGYLWPDFQPLAQQHRLLFYDQRGGGRSELLPDDPALYTMERHVADLEALRQHFGLERMTLVAHSFGPMIAAGYAMAHPERVARMIFLGPLPPRSGKLWKRYGDNIDARLTPEERSLLATLERDMTSGPDPVEACRAYWALALKPRVARPELISRVRGDFCSVDAAAIRSGMAVAGPRTLESLGDWDYRPGLAHVAAPTLVLHGDAEAIPMDLVEEWTTALPSARLIHVPGAAHFAYVERPDVVWPAIEEFLRSTPP
ncbi:MAG TPA: alpha/beta fold hydrolase [Polyangiaceae bacterium]|nr:alpha/beta fold hydrolase [Polyangiaceae bacterium]